MNDFELFWDLFNPDTTFCNRKFACRTLWDQLSGERRQAIIDFLQKRKPEQQNPYFFLADFRIPRPKILTFRDYYAQFGTTEEQNGWKRVFNPQLGKTWYEHS